MWTLIVRPEAEEEIREAYLWYEKQRAGLGDDFLLRIEAALESLLHDPFIHGYIYKQIRRKLARRFPYGVFFKVENEQIAVLAVLHAKRNPLRWRNPA